MNEIDDTDFVLFCVFFFFFCSKIESYSTLI